MYVHQYSSFEYVLLQSAQWIKQEGEQAAFIIIINLLKSHPTQYMDHNRG